MRPSYLWKMWGSITSTAAALVFFFQPAVASTLAEQRSATEQLTVLISATFKGDPEPEIGAGILVARRGARMYVMTAGHVVWRGAAARKIKVFPLWLNANRRAVRSVTATLAHAPEDDVAVLVFDVDGATAPSDQLQFWALGDPSKLRQLDALRPIGFPSGHAWETCAAPDSFDTLADSRITFNSQCVEQGHSGGPLVDETWRIVGLTQLSQQPHAYAFEVSAALEKLKRWGVPIDLARQAAADRSAFVQIVLGQRSDCGLTTTGRIYCWGSNSDLALGTGSEDTNFKTDIGVQIADRRVFRRLAAGAGGSFCALTLEGRAVCWGNNNLGQLGADLPTAIATPTVVNLNLRFNEIALGLFYSCGLQKDGSPVCWGDTLGVTTDVQEALRRSGIRWRQLAAGTSFNCGVAVDGGLYCWGIGHPSVFGGALDPNLDHKVTVAEPKRLFPDRKFKNISISEAGLFACGLDEGGAVSCWGELPTKLPSIHKGEVVLSAGRAIASAEKFTAVAAGRTSACAVEVSGKVLCWGYFTTAGEALTILGLTNAVDISGGTGEAFCAKTRDGVGVCVIVSDELFENSGAYVDASRGPFRVRISRCDPGRVGKVPAAIFDALSYRDISLLPDVGAAFQYELFPNDFESIQRRSGKLLEGLKIAFIACDADPASTDVKAIMAVAEAEAELLAAKSDYEKEYEDVPKVPGEYIFPSYKRPPQSYFDRFARALERYRRAIDAADPR